MELLNDDLDLQVPTLRKNLGIYFLGKAMKYLNTQFYKLLFDIGFWVSVTDVSKRRYIRLTEATPEGTR